MIVNGMSAHKRRKPQLAAGIALATRLNFVWILLGAAILGITGIV